MIYRCLEIQSHRGQERGPTQGLILISSWHIIKIRCIVVVMTRSVFWEDPYLSHLNTKVKKVDGEQIILEDTIAYAESGGQESDLASLNGVPVLQSVLDSSKKWITYFLPEDHGFKEGDSVSLEIDWRRRYRLMRHHFACELVLVLMNRYFLDQKIELKPENIDQSIKKVGAHMSEDKARVDFLLGENLNKYLEIIHPQFQEIIDSNLTIETGYFDESKRKRYWRVDGLATVPCGGTHVKRTGEIGSVTLKRKRANKGVERVYIYLDSP